MNTANTDTRLSDAAIAAEVETILRESESTIVDLARLRLAAELGRRMGWPRYKWDRRGVSHLCGKRPQWNDSQFMPWADHSSFYAIGSRVTALVEQPYFDYEPTRHSRLAEIYTWAKEYGVEVHRPDFPSWWFPGRTELLLITLPGAAATLT